jgi:uncharacterized membrane protein
LRKLDLRWLLVALVFLAFSLRVVGLSTQSLWRDEVDSVRFASRPLEDLLQTFATPGQNGPLYFLVLRPWLNLVGQSEFSLRFWSVLFGVLAVPLIYRLSRRLFPGDTGVAVVAALLTALSPYLVWYSQEGKMYAGVVALILLSMDRFLAALQKGSWHRWLIYILVTAAALYSHLIAALIIPVQVFVFLLFFRQIQPDRRRACLLSLGALMVPYLPLLAWQMPMLRDVGQTGYPFVPLPEMVMSLMANYTLGVLQEATPWSAALFVALLAASGLFLFEGPSRRRSIAVLVTWLLLPVIGFFLVTISRPMFTARYLIFVLPALLLLLAAGIAAVWRRSRIIGGILLALVLATGASGLWLQARTPVKADFRAATRYVANRMGDEDMILFQMPYGRHSFDYYYRRVPSTLPPREASGEFRLYLPAVRSDGALSYFWADGLYTNSGMPEHEADWHMSELLAGTRFVWLVASEVPMWDERGLVKSWLDQHATMNDQANFTRVDVYRYELPHNDK